MTTLFEPIMDARPHYCGPTAVSILTGVPMSRIHDMIRRKRRGGYRDANGRKLPVKGTYTWEIVRVLKRLGCKVTKLAVRPTSLGQFCDDAQFLGPCLVEVTGHFMAYDRGVLRDNSHPAGISATGYPKSRRTVRQVWKVEAPETPKYGAPVERPRKPKPPRDLIAERTDKVRKAIKRWEAKQRRAATALRKLRKQERYYGRRTRHSGVSAPDTTDGGAARGASPEVGA